MNNLNLIRVAIDVSKKFDVDYKVVCAIIQHESSWNQYACRHEPNISPLRWLEHNCFKTLGIEEATDLELQKFSLGLMQILGSTARGIGYMGNLLSLSDPREGVIWGTKYLKGLIHRWPNVKDFISAYNAGHPIWTFDRDNATYVDKVTHSMGNY